MSAILVIVTIFLALAGGLGLVAYISYRRVLRRAKAVERGLKMVPVLIHLPPPSADTALGSRDIREVMREKTAQAEVLYNLIAGTAQGGFKSNFYGQRHIALEIIASAGVVHFYVAIPVALVSVVEQAIQTAYPGAKLEEVEDHNIFSQAGKLTTTLGGEITTKFEYAYPINTYKRLERDPLEAMLNTFSKLQSGDGAAVQIMLRPAPSSWIKRSTKLVKKKMRNAGKSVASTYDAKSIAKAVVAAPDRDKEFKSQELTGIERATIEAIEEKTKFSGFEALIRVVVSTESVAHSQSVLQELANSFALFEAPGLNGFKFMSSPNPQALVDAFIFRFFPPEVNWMILNTTELATLYHLPDSQFTPTANIARQQNKEVDGPPTMPTSGLLFGYNEFRGKRSEVRLSTNDRRRHTYIIGQTGTGKTTMLENLLVQDMLAGNGFAFIDPHGDGAEKILGLVPKSRAEDVIYFDPSNTDYPMGLNLFEFKEPREKDFLIQETLNMLYKLYDPNGNGTIGPRFEQWFRNAALTLMSDPNGATFIEIPKVFTDTDYLKDKFKYLTDPTVIEFWTKEMGQTSDYHKSEMLGYFVSKFGAFQQNEMMRNIIGQTKSSFNLRDIMDNKKILLVNLSKGRLGEMNAKLLGMMFVIKFQAAAMSRADMPEDKREDFSLYVDEFQNFSTDSFASILSEARKYRLNLIVANQFIGQLTNEIRDAVFGNVGTIISHRVGPEDAEFMTKQFAPAFDARDLVNIPNFNSVIKLLVGGLPSQPFSMADLPQVTGESIELGNAVKQLSAAKYGHPKELVAADIAARLSVRASGPTPPAPKPGAEEPIHPEPVVVPPPPVAPPAAALPGATVVATEATPSPVTVTPQAPPQSVPVPAPIAVVAPAPAQLVDEHKTLSLDSISRVAGPTSVAMPDAAVTPPPSLIKVPQPNTNKLANETQVEIDELLESSHLAKPVRHHLSESAPELITGEPKPMLPGNPTPPVLAEGVVVQTSATSRIQADTKLLFPNANLLVSPVEKLVDQSGEQPAKNSLVKVDADVSIKPIQADHEPRLAPPSEPPAVAAVTTVLDMGSSPSDEVKPTLVSVEPQPMVVEPALPLPSLDQPTPTTEPAQASPTDEADFSTPETPPLLAPVSPPEPAITSKALDLTPADITPPQDVVPSPELTLSVAEVKATEAIPVADPDAAQSTATEATAPDASPETTDVMPEATLEPQAEVSAVLAGAGTVAKPSVKPDEAASAPAGLPAGAPKLAPGEIYIDPDGNVYQGAME